MLPSLLQRSSHVLQQRQQAAPQQEEQQLPHALSDVQNSFGDPGLELRGEKRSEAHAGCRAAPHALTLGHRSSPPILTHSSSQGRRSPTQERMAEHCLLMCRVSSATFAQSGCSVGCRRAAAREQQAGSVLSNHLQGNAG